MDSLVDVHRLSDADVCGNAAEEGGWTVFAPYCSCSTSAISVLLDLGNL